MTPEREAALLQDVSRLTGDVRVIGVQIGGLSASQERVETAVADLTGRQKTDRLDMERAKVGLRIVLWLGGAAVAVGMFVVAVLGKWGGTS